VASGLAAAASCFGRPPAWMEAIQRQEPWFKASVSASKEHIPRRQVGPRLEHDVLGAGGVFSCAAAANKSELAGPSPDAAIETRGTVEPAESCILELLCRGPGPSVPAKRLELRPDALVSPLSTLRSSWLSVGDTEPTCPAVRTAEPVCAAKQGAEAGCLELASPGPVVTALEEALQLGLDPFLGPHTAQAASEVTAGKAELASPPLRPAGSVDRVPKRLATGLLEFLA
jgi:hypothetical protein